ncbi:MAG: phosphomethylpyrimidine synthase ThiC [Candidatus Cloacimonetes bacterium]|nr:phosphomethylpyrimidine synthase ThiC [Candidatus Cloacimonadota bacterium]MBL7086669.1 phosphomethylpyrimidine synthase ThiC [Candidatus Cloacimonadota bacterium]
MTQLKMAKDGIISKEMKAVAKDEKIDAQWLCQEIANGHIVIPKNINRDFHPAGIGNKLRTKINANIGTSPDHFDLNEELEKLKISVAYGSDSVMDLSTGGNLTEIRKAILHQSPVMVGTVPIYQVASELLKNDKDISQMSVNQLFESIEKQCDEGVDYITVHCGVTQKSIQTLKKNPRLLGVVSRGGSLLMRWMRKNKAENPLYEYYDRLLDIARKYDVTLSLGDGLRPGCLADASDSAQFAELIILGELQKKALESDVQSMIEGPGHIPLNEIEANVRLEKSICNGAPFYVLGPITTDIAPGYDHITSAIGGALAAYYGADFLCYVTPSEHLCLPDIDDVREGVISARISARSADIANGIAGIQKEDDQISLCRSKLDWEGIYKLAMDPILAKKRRKESEDFSEDVCTMCGKLCAIKTSKKNV